MGASLKVTGLTSTKRAMVRREAAIRNRRGVYRAAALEIQGWTMRNMQAEGRLHERGNLRWPDLSERTKRERAKIGKWPGKMLQQRGRLIGSFQVSASAGEGTVVNRVRYSVKHEYGTRRIPQRKMFPTLEQGVKIVMPVFEHWLHRALQ